MLELSLWKKNKFSIAQGYLKGLCFTEVLK